MDKPKKYEERLMDALSFKEADLAANQTGELTRRQIARLNRSRQSQALGGAFILLVGVIAVTLVLSAVNFAFLTPAILAILAGMGALFIGLSAFIWSRSARMSADLRENRIAEVEGRVDLSVRAGQNSATYYLNVGGKRFTLRQKAFLAFKNGDPYRIFYLPRSKRILSVEWLREYDDNLLEAPVEAESEGEPAGVETQTENRPTLKASG